LKLKLNVRVVADELTGGTPPTHRAPSDHAPLVFPCHTYWAGAGAQTTTRVAHTATVRAKFIENPWIDDVFEFVGPAS
jgi:hypothetical protein